MKFEIEISEENLKKLHNLQSIDKQLREQYDASRIDVDSPRIEKLAERINLVVRDINQILINAIYENKDWQSK